MSEKQYHATPEEAMANGWSRAWTGKTKGGEERVYGYILPYRQRVARCYWLEIDRKPPDAATFDKPWPCLLCSSFRSAKYALEAFKKRYFPKETLVYVTAHNYTGYGIVDTKEACPPDQLPVRLCNGNVWWYPLDQCTKAVSAETLEVIEKSKLTQEDKAKKNVKRRKRASRKPR